MTGETNLQKLINTMTPMLSEHEYIFATLHAPTFEYLESLDPIGTFKEKEGLTVILLKSKADELAIDYSGIFRCITLNVHSSLDAVGLTATVSTKLTQVNISANVVAAYYHVHIFVASQDANKAIKALNELVKEGIT